jgi:hypothetical protein
LSWNLFIWIDYAFEDVHLGFMEVGSISLHFEHPGGTLLFGLTDVDWGMDQVGVVSAAHLQGTTCVGSFEMVTVKGVILVRKFNRHRGIEVLGVFGHAEVLDVCWIGQL